MVLFFVASGVQIGIGHVKRCVQLAIDLREQDKEVLFCLEHDFESIEIIKKCNLNVSILNETNSILNVLEDNPNIRVVLLDVLNITEKDTRKIKESNSNVKILALDYFDMLDSNVDTIINLYNHNKKYSKPVNPDVKYLEGPKYGVLRNEFQPLLLKRSFSKRELRKILITFGGSDPKKYTLSILPVLDEIFNNLSINLSIVIGPNFVHASQISEVVKDLKSVYELIHNPSDMAKLMVDTDLCICGSGTTILELSALGVPAIVIPQSLEELRFSSLFETAGFATIVGTPGSIDRVKLKYSLMDYYTNPEKLVTMGLAGIQLCDGKGKDRIAREVLTLLNK